jgi:hypothetical protein
MAMLVVEKYPGFAAVVVKASRIFLTGPEWDFNQNPQDMSHITECTNPEYA